MPLQFAWTRAGAIDPPPSCQGYRYLRVLLKYSGWKYPLDWRFLTTPCSRARVFKRASGPAANRPFCPGRGCAELAVAVAIENGVKTEGAGGPFAVGEKINLRAARTARAGGLRKRRGGSERIRCTRCTHQRAVVVSVGNVSGWLPPATLF